MVLSGQYKNEISPFSRDISVEFAEDFTRRGGGGEIGKSVGKGRGEGFPGVGGGEEREERFQRRGAEFPGFQGKFHPHRRGE